MTRPIPVLRAQGAAGGSSRALAIPLTSAPDPVSEPSLPRRTPSSATATRLSQFLVKLTRGTDVVSEEVRGRGGSGGWGGSHGPRRSLVCPWRPVWFTPRLALHLHFCCLQGVDTDWRVVTQLQDVQALRVIMEVARAVLQLHQVRAEPTWAST